MPAANVYRIRTRRPDGGLHTTRLVGAGWSWECGCGEKGPWHSTRPEATESARVHRLYAHGSRQ